MRAACHTCGRWPKTKPWRGECCSACRPPPEPKPKAPRKPRARAGAYQPPSKLDAAQAESLVERYLAGELVRTLGVEYRLSREGVYRYLRRAGVVLTATERACLRQKPEGERRWAIHELLTAEEWDLAYWGEGEPSISELAAWLELKPCNVEWALRVHDIPRRAKGEQAALTWAKGKARAATHQQKGASWTGGDHPPRKREALLAELRARPEARIPDLVRPGRSWCAVSGMLVVLLRQGRVERVARGVYRAREE